MNDDYTAVSALIERMTDLQLEVAGLRPTYDARPAVVAWHQVGTGAILANASAAIAFPVGGSAPFVARQMRLWSTGPLLINIKVSSMGEAFAAGPMHSVATFGPATNPEPLNLDRPWLMDERATIMVEVQNLTAAANEFAIILVGYRAK